MHLGKRDERQTPMTFDMSTPEMASWRPDFQLRLRWITDVTMSLRLQKRYPRDHQLLSSKREKQIQADLGKCLKDLDGFWILMISTAHETRIFFPSPSLYPLSYDCTPRIHCLEPWTAWNHCTFKSFTRMGGRSYCENGLEKLLYISKETSRNEIPKYRKIT